MRCTDAVLSAFLAHPKYQTRQDFIQWGREFVLTRKGSSIAAENWAFAYYLPITVARDALTQCLPEIARKQQSTGLWKRKFARKISYGILRAFRHAQMLPELITDGVLRYDPYMPFSESSDIYGFLVRRNVMDAMPPGDPILQRQLVSQITSLQREDGSWEGTVVMTSLQLEQLLELGLDADESCVEKGTAWILSQFHETTEGRRPKRPVEVTAQSVISVRDRRSEFRSALNMIPEEDPKSGCFSSLPLIQTVLALRIIVRLGFGNDKRVLQAYESLLDIRYPDSWWCATGCRRMLEERVKPKRRREA